jgi:hypothetical protein
MVCPCNHAILLSFKVTMAWQISHTLYFIPGCEELAVEKFQAKINLDNNKSISMFQKIGFAKVSLTFFKLCNMKL